MDKIGDRTQTSSSSAPLLLAYFMQLLHSWLWTQPVTNSPIWNIMKTYLGYLMMQHDTEGMLFKNDSCQWLAPCERRCSAERQWEVHHSSEFCLADPLQMWKLLQLVHYVPVWQKGNCCCADIHHWALYCGSAVLMLTCLSEISTGMYQTWGGFFLVFFPKCFFFLLWYYIPFCPWN